MAAVQNVSSASPAKRRQFACNSDDQLDKILSEKDSTNTVKSTDATISLLRMYIAANRSKIHCDIDLDQAGKAELNALLYHFYAE